MDAIYFAESSKLLLDASKNLLSSTNGLSASLKTSENNILGLVEYAEKVKMNISKFLNVNNIINAQPEKRELSKEEKESIIKDPKDYKDAAASGLYKFESEFGNSFKNLQTLVYSSAVAMRENMNNFFFDAMTGKLKTAEEYFKSFLTSIQKAIAQFLANEITNKLIKTLFGGLFEGNNDNKDNGTGLNYKFDPLDFSNFEKYQKYFIPKNNAIGGRMALNTPFIAGENGPELINIDGAGATVVSNNTTQSMLAGQNNLAVEVNVINQSGTQMQASQGESRFDGQKYVVDVFLDAWARDVSGLRTAVGGRR